MPPLRIPDHTLPETFHGPANGGGSVGGAGGRSCTAHSTQTQLYMGSARDDTIALFISYSF